MSNRRSPREYAADAARIAATQYFERRERGALRCALSDAAILCDLISDQILQEGRRRYAKSAGRGAPTKQARALADIATRCADEIAAMRRMIEVPK